ncbi:hypothetical protein [Thalassotalea crassostreae]|uniref:hypothetical protein n=1 Tax=Thalassotalea crassostreae TaxID=1763536 RepID=UPI0008390C56|nr:hypothetical protein [Thalassotalea crassostreae]
MTKNIIFILVFVLSVSGCATSKANYGFKRPPAMVEPMFMSCDDMYNWSGLIMTDRQNGTSIVDASKKYKGLEKLVMAAYDVPAYDPNYLKKDAALKFATAFYKACYEAKHNNK